MFFFYQLILHIPLLGNLTNNITTEMHMTGKFIEILFTIIWVKNALNINQVVIMNYFARYKLEPNADVKIDV